MRIVAGWLREARQVPTRQFNARPPGTLISLIVIHCIALPPGCYGGDAVDRLFTGTLEAQAHPYFRALAGAELSTHFFISRDGRLTQYVSCLDRAWHAGRSSYRGVAECNDYAVGIELEGSESCAFCPPQYAVLTNLVSALQKAYPEIKNRVAAHSEVAPGRKHDPGPHFSWQWLPERASSEL